RWPSGNAALSCERAGSGAAVLVRRSIERTRGAVRAQRALVGVALPLLAELRHHLRQFVQCFRLRVQALSGPFHPAERRDVVQKGIQHLTLFELEQRHCRGLPNEGALLLTIDGIRSNDEK